MRLCRKKSALAENTGREITVTAITDYCHDYGILQLLRQLQRRPYGTTGRHATENSFFARQTLHGDLGILLLHIHHHIHARAIKNRRQIFLGPAPDAGNLRAIRRLQADNFNAGIFFLEKARAAHDGAGGAHGADEVRNRALSLLPDFRAGRTVMRQWIVAIAELVEHAPFALGLHLYGEIACALHAFFLRDGNQLGAVSRHGITAFLALVVGHDEDHAIALDGRHHGQRNTGIAAGGLDQGIAGTYVATGLGLGNHAQCRSVLHGTRRVIALQFDQHGIGGATRQTLQAHERCVADGIGNRGVNGHRGKPAVRREGAIVRAGAESAKHRFHSGQYCFGPDTRQAMDAVIVRTP